MSSLISSYTWEPRDNRQGFLTITFASNGSTWKYLVPLSVGEGFEEASSKGKYFNHVVKNHSAVRV